MELCIMYDRKIIWRQQLEPSFLQLMYTATISCQNLVTLNFRAPKHQVVLDSNIATAELILLM